MLLAAALAVTMAGCADADTSADSAGSGNVQISQNDPHPDETSADEKNLTISSVYAFELREYARKYMMENPGVTIEVNSYDDVISSGGDWGMVRQEIATQMMAGSGPVLIEGQLADYLDPRTEAFFVDWLPIMAADPGFNEEDWFMNAFQAAATNGRLYAFLTKFSYKTATTNTTVPSLFEKMSDIETVTIPELMELHREMNTEVSFFLAPSFGVGTYADYCITDFIDIETGRVDVDSDRFITAINNASEASIKGAGGPEVMPVTSGQERVWGDTYYFNIADVNNMLFRYFLAHEEPLLFSGLVPIVNEREELIIYPYESYALNANATAGHQELAWDFIQFMMEPANQSEGGFILMQPTNRNLFRFAVERDLPNVVRTWQWQLSGSVDKAVEDTLTKMTAYGEMPMQNMRALPHAIIGPGGIIPEAMRLFEEGLVSAEQTARDLQNQVELVMMEMDMR